MYAGHFQRRYRWANSQVANHSAMAASEKNNAGRRALSLPPARSSTVSACSGPRGGRRRVPDQLGLDHDALARAVLRVARHQRQPVVALVRRGSPWRTARRCGGPSAASPPVRVARLGHHLVGELALQGLDEDLVAGLQLVDPVERRLVGRAVAGERGVAGLAGHRRLGEVARALPAATAARRPRPCRSRRRSGGSR